MSTSDIKPIKYVFLDVVAYSNRIIEAQCDITNALNEIVKGSINRYKISNDSLIYIPTGDGICIALLDATLPYDIHITIALEILRRIWVYNSSMADKMRKFEVRIGINQSDDNVVEDINGRKNVTGAGINNARRIMDLADDSQILVSRTVYDTLHQRKEYFGAFSSRFTKTVKHGVVLEVYQLIRANIAGFNVDPPSSLATPPKPEPKLTKLTAYYFAHAIKNERFILNKARESAYRDNWLKLLLWFLAKDSEKASETTPYNVYVTRVMPDTGSDVVEGQFEWFFKKIPAEVAIDLSYMVVDNAVPSSIQCEYLERMSDSLVVNSKGKEKLKRDWPAIWDEFKLDEL